MADQSNHRFYEVPAIDLTYRPASYFWPLGLETHLLATVKGAERRAELQRLLLERQSGNISDFVAKASLSDAERRAFGRIHPSFMGGEYLPDHTERELEIARITIASTTQDVTSVYARKGKNRIYYRVVDEYGGETLSGKTARTSIRSLTLGELEKFFNGAWSIFDVLDMNFDTRGHDLARMLNFVVSVDSAYYPNIDALYRRRIVEWARDLKQQ